MKLSVVILAGGKSRRMGQDKALLTVGDRPFLARTIDIAQTLSDDVWVMTPWRESYQAFFSDKVQWLDDPLQDGALVALSQAIAHLSADWILLLACDLPHLDIEQLQRWKNTVENLPPEYAMALVKSEKFYEPLCGFYRANAQASLQKFIDNGDRSFQKWLAAETVYDLDLADKTMLFNCNTPEDFATLKANSS